jgi:predicted AAA+ superfamily ATPase
MEIDFILENGKELFPIEVKSSLNISIRDCGNILKFMEYHKNAKYGAVIYAGNEVKWIHSKIICLPWYIV